MKSIIAAVIALVICVGGVERGVAQELRLNLMREDSFATRRIQVFKKSGEKVSGVVSIQSFDSGSNSFVLRGVAGESIQFATDDLGRIEFEQELLKQQPQAQSGPFEVSMRLGDAVRYRVPPAGMKIDAGDLVLPASAPSTKISLPAEAVKASREGGSVSSQKILEAKKLTWDAASKSFLVDVQEIVYSRTEFGGGGASGVRK